MKYRKVINQPIEVDENGVTIRGGVNAVVAATINEPGDNQVSSHQKVRVVQRNGVTEVFEHSTDDDDKDQSDTSRGVAERLREGDIGEESDDSREVSDMPNRLKGELKKRKEELKQRINDAAKDDSNIASSVNVGGSGSHTSVSSRQEVVTKDGVTTKREIREERRS
jgi:hypothetical protein